MPSYDDDQPTQQERRLIKKLVDNVEDEERIQAVTEVHKFKFKSSFSSMTFVIA